MAAMPERNARRSSMTVFPAKHSRLLRNHGLFFHACIILLLDSTITFYLSYETLMEWSDRIGRRIKLRDLHILLSVVQQGSIAGAARHLAVSQPAVSKVIADLEHVLGVRLLDRDRHGAEPTLYGEALLQHGVVAFDALRQGVMAVEFLADPTLGELRIGATNALAMG